MRTKHKAPGKSHRQGVDLFQIIALFPDDVIAERWFEETLWGAERCCGHCGSVATSQTPKRKPMPYWCKDCRSYFSVRTGTAIARSNIPLRKWAVAIYLCLTSLKSVSSMKLHRDINVSQPTAWFMLHRIREAWAHEPEDLFDGPAEADESFFGGRRANMPKSRRKQLEGRGVAGKVAVAGVKDRTSNQVRARVVGNTDSETLQGFVRDSVKSGATLYTDDATAYNGMKDYDHESVKHSVSEYVRGMAHTNGIESFWSMLKRAHKGTFHKLSPKHLDRYVREFAGRHNIRELGTLAQMRDTVARLVGRNLLYRDLIRDNGLPSGSRS